MTEEQRRRIEGTIVFFRGNNFWQEHCEAMADALQAILDFQPEKPFDNGKPEWLGGF